MSRVINQIERYLLNVTYSSLLIELIARVLVSLSNIPNEYNPDIVQTTKHTDLSYSEYQGHPLNDLFSIQNIE